MACCLVWSCSCVYIVSAYICTLMVYLHLYTPANDIILWLYRIYTRDCAFKVCWLTSILLKSTIYVCKGCTMNSKWQSNGTIFSRALLWRVFFLSLLLLASLYFQMLFLSSRVRHHQLDHMAYICRDCIRIFLWQSISYTFIVIMTHKAVWLYRGTSRYGVQTTLHPCMEWNCTQSSLFGVTLYIYSLIRHVSNYIAICL